MLPPQLMLAKKVFDMTSTTYRLWRGMPAESRRRHRAQAGRVASLTLELSAALAKLGLSQIIPAAALKTPDDIPVDRGPAEAPRDAPAVVRELGTEAAVLIKALTAELTEGRTSKSARLAHWAATREQGVPLGSSKLAAAAKLSGRLGGVGRTGGSVVAKAAKAGMAAAATRRAAAGAGDPLLRAGLAEDDLAIVQLDAALAGERLLDGAVLEVSRAETLDFQDSQVGLALVVLRPSGVAVVARTPQVPEADGIPTAGENTPPLQVAEKRFADYVGLDVADAGGPSLLFAPREQSEPFLLSWQGDEERDRMAAAIEAAWRLGPEAPTVTRQ